MRVASQCKTVVPKLFLQGPPLEDKNICAHTLRQILCLQTPVKFSFETLSVIIYTELQLSL